MRSYSSLCRRSAVAGVLGLGWLFVSIAVGSGGAQSEGLRGAAGALGNAVGGAVNGAVGAVGGALGAATASSRGVASPDDGNDAGSARGGEAAARSGNWVGAPFILVARRSDGQDSCDGALIDIFGRACSANSPQDVSEDPGQTSSSDENETAVPDTVPQPQPPAMARLNDDKPIVEKPALTVIPKAKPPITSAKAPTKSPALLSCDKAETIVDGYGFSAVKPSDCDGQVFAFNASRDGKPYLVTLNAVSGELIQVRKLSTTALPQQD